MDAPLAETRSTCPYCGTGCGVLVQARAGRIVGVRGDPDHPANFGKLCPKGASLAQTAQPEVLMHARLLRPQARPDRGVAPQALGWDAALELAAERFAAAIRDRGPDSVGFYVSGQLLTEDYYAFNKLARALVGTNNIDSNSRLCMSSAVVGYKRTLGADAPPCNYEDLDHADCVLVIGANPAAAHPVLFGRLLEARRARGTKLIVADPRLTESARSADLHLALRPGTDLYLLGALLGVMLRDALIDEAYIAAHTRGFAAAAAQARALPLAEAARITGLAAGDIERAARLFARSAATLSLWCQGLNQSSHGSDNSAALIHLHLATGQIGRPGTGPFSLTGQPNAMGGRETGSMATLLPGHRDPQDAADRAELARLWGVESLPSAAGLPALELFEAAAAGRIQALWIACTNPAYSLPDQALVRQALAAVPFVVVQEAYATETTALADLLLPAATFGERCGTMTNSERRVSLSQPAVPPPGEARPDWAIAAQFARSLAARIAPARAGLFDWPDAAAVFAEYTALTAGRDLDIAGLDHARLARGPVQWPLRADAAARGTADTGTARLYTDGRYPTADGRAQFVQIELRAAAVAPSAEFPLALTSVRLRDQWHGGSRSAMAATLAMPPAVLQVAPASLAAAGLADGELARVSSAQGQLTLPVQASDTLPEGVAALAMHHGARWLPGSLGINGLSTRARDPLSRQPELKHVPVRVAPLALPWHTALLARVPRSRVLPLLEVLAREIEPLRHAALARFPAGDDAGVLLFAAHGERPDRLMQELRLLLGIEQGAPSLAEARSGRLRCLQISAGRLHAVVLEGVRRADLAAWPLYQRLVASGDDCSTRPLRELFAPELGSQPA